MPFLGVKLKRFFFNNTLFLMDGDLVNEKERLVNGKVAEMLR